MTIAWPMSVIIKVMCIEDVKYIGKFEMKKNCVDKYLNKILIL